MKRIIYFILLGISFILGQESIKYCYDLRALENNTIELLKFSYLVGCSENSKNTIICLKKANLYKEKLSPIILFRK